MYAVGVQGTIMHYDGIKWSDVESGVDVDLNGIWGSSDTKYMPLVRREQSFTTEKS